MSGIDDVVGLSERDKQIYRWRVINRLTYREINKRLNDEISEQRIGQIFNGIREKIAAQPTDIDALRQESLDLYHDIQRRMQALADLNGAPVTAGKDGDVVLDPEDGSVVRDFSARMQALRLAADADKEIRKLHGLDAATKIEHSGSVRYEVAGVDLDALS